MAPRQPTPSFDDIINAGRQRKKDEELANRIFGKGRKQSAPRSGVYVKSERPPSLASRVTKASARSKSSSPILKAKIIANHGKQHSLLSHGDHLNHSSPTLGGHAGDLTRNTGKNIKGFNIRGLAGPCVVIGSNFAPGTTNADIQSAMDSVVGGMQSCRIVTSSPTVIAEMVYEDKAAADTIIATFNNQKARADGRLLHVYMKQGGPSPVARADENYTPSLTDMKRMSQEKLRSDSAFVDVNGQSPSAHVKRADPEIQDGSYGFESQEEAMEVDTEPRQGPRREEERRVDRRNEKYDYRRDYEPGYRRDERRTGNEHRRDDRYIDQVVSARDGRRPYQDYSSYPRQRGRGFR